MKVRLAFVAVVLAVASLVLWALLLLMQARLELERRRRLGWA